MSWDKDNGKMAKEAANAAIDRINELIAEGGAGGGLKGDPFTYEDFTPTQLESLKGPKDNSAYEVAVANGFIGTETEWLESLEDSGGSGISNVKRYSTIAEMKSDSTLADNDVVTTLGYRSIGDGGGATYRIGTSASAEDAGSVFVLGNNKRAFLTTDLNDINVKQFGAYGDGVTDDITFIENAITFLSNRGGGILRFDGGTYLISTSIVMKSYVTLLGIPNKTVILTNANTFDAIEYITETLNSEVNGFVIRPTGGINEGSRNAAFYFGRNISLIQCNLRNLVIESFYSGIDVRNFWKASFVENVHILNCRTGINVEQTFSGDVSTLTFLNVFIEDSKYRALSIQHIEGFTFIGCRIQGDNTVGYTLEAVSCRGISFNNCRFDGMDSTTASVAMFTCSGNGVVTFDNCHFIDYLSTGTDSSIFSVATGGKMSLNACSFEEIYSSSFTYTFRVEAGSRITYSNCADISTLPPNYKSSTGFLIDVDSALTEAAALN